MSRNASPFPASFPAFLRFVLMACLATAASMALHAQTPRRILIEEGTNASCTPCAAQNPAFESFLDRAELSGRVIPLVYHAWWPGIDVMNRENPDMNDERVRWYYGWLSIPTGVANGAQWPARTPGLGAGAPGDTVGLREIIDTLAADTTSISISIEDSIDAARMSAFVTVSSTSPIRGWLRIAVVERRHNYPDGTAGTNGEEHFPWIVRAMLPSAAGRFIELSADSTFAVRDTISIRSSWDPHQMYFVAFLQDDSTREVLQAASTGSHLRLELLDRPGQRRRAGDTSDAVWRLRARPTGDGPATLSLTSDMPAGWNLSLRDSSGARLDSGSIIRLDAGSACDLVLTLRGDSLHPGRGTIRVALLGWRGATSEVEVRLYTGDPGIPVFAWFDSTGGKTAVAWRRAMDRTRLSFAMVDRADEDLFDLRDHRLVVAAVGNEPLRDSDVGRLREFLGAKGRLLISGATIAESLADLRFSQTGRPRDTAFLHNYLHAGYEATGSSTRAVNGIPRDPIGDGIGFNLPGGLPGGGPDRLRQRRNSLRWLYYGSSRDSIAGIRYGRPEHRVVFTGIALETVPGDSLRGDILRRAIQWLLGEEITVDVPPLQPTSQRIHIYPNPASESVRIEMNHAFGPATIEVIDVLGRVVRRQSSAPATAVWLDLRGLPPGMYTIRGETRERTEIDRLVVR